MSVALAAPPPPHRHYAHPAPAAPETPGQLRAVARSLEARWRLDPETCYLLGLAATEMVANVLRHSPEVPHLCAVFGIEAGCAHVTVVDTGRGLLGLPPVLAQGRDRQHGLLLLLGLGLRVEQLLLSDGLNRVHMWTPLDPARRALVCPCPCWAAGHSGPPVGEIGRCSELIGDGGRTVSAFGQPATYCSPCAEHAEGAPAPHQTLILSKA